jgi:uncharacterized integral membrane protein
MRIFLAIMVVLLILLLIFAVQNPGSTQVKFLNFASTVSLLLIILLSAIVGLLAGLAVMLPGNLRRSARIRKLEAEVAQLRLQSAEWAAAVAKGRLESGESTVAGREDVGAAGDHATGNDVVTRGA